MCCEFSFDLPCVYFFFLPSHPAHPTPPFFSLSPQLPLPLGLDCGALTSARPPLPPRPPAMASRIGLRMQVLYSTRLPFSHMHNIHDISHGHLCVCLSGHWRGRYSAKCIGRVMYVKGIYVQRLFAFSTDKFSFDIRSMHILMYALCYYRYRSHLLLFAKALPALHLHCRTEKKSQTPHHLPSLKSISVCVSTADARPAAARGAA